MSEEEYIIATRISDSELEYLSSIGLTLPPHLLHLVKRRLAAEKIPQLFHMRNGSHRNPEASGERRKTVA